MPESLLHIQLRTALWQLLDHHFGHLGLAGSDQFIYWDPADPKKNLAPDVYYKLGAQLLPLTSWKTWKRGVPELAIEIVSDADSAARAREKSVARYTTLGVCELLRFDRRDDRTLLEAWDIADGTAVPRTIGDDLSTPCRTLGCHFVVAPLAGLGRALRIARDPEGKDLFATDREERDRAERVAAEVQSRAAEVQSRANALEAEIAALRAKLAGK